MLDRIRVGCPTASDIETLKERIIPTEKTINEIKNAVNKYNEVSVKYPGLLVLLPKNAKVNQFNELMSKLKVANITSVNSIDIQKSTNSSIKQPNYICGKKQKTRRVSRPLNGVVVEADVLGTHFLFFFF